MATQVRDPKQRTLSHWYDVAWDGVSRPKESAVGFAIRTRGLVTRMLTRNQAGFDACCSADVEHARPMATCCTDEETQEAVRRLSTFAFVGFSICN